MLAVRVALAPAPAAAAAAAATAEAPKWVYDALDVGGRAVAALERLGRDVAVLRKVVERDAMEEEEEEDDAK